MRAFVDTSVLVRKLFGEPNPLAEWSSIDEAYASRMLTVEIGRVIDRARLGGAIDDEQVVELHEEARRMIRSIDIMEIDETVLSRAAGPMPTMIGTLDAIHLATALELTRSVRVPIVIATHDMQLARAARALGFQVVGA